MLSVLYMSITVIERQTTYLWQALLTLTKGEIIVELLVELVFSITASGRLLLGLMTYMSSRSVKYNFFDCWCAIFQLLSISRHSPLTSVSRYLPTDVLFIISWVLRVCRQFPPHISHHIDISIKSVTSLHDCDLTFTSGGGADGGGVTCKPVIAVWNCVFNIWRCDTCIHCILWIDDRTQSNHQNKC